MVPLSVSADTLQAMVPGEGQRPRLRIGPGGGVDGGPPARRRVAARSPRSLRSALYAAFRRSTALGVLTRSVVDAADRRSSVECGVAPVVVVGMQEVLQGIGAFGVA